jgi:hypothetical protein
MRDTKLQYSVNAVMPNLVPAGIFLPDQTFSGARKTLLCTVIANYVINNESLHFNGSRKRTFLPRVEFLLQIFTRLRKRLGTAVLLVLKTQMLYVPYFSVLIVSGFFNSV